MRKALIAVVVLIGVLLLLTVLGLGGGGAAVMRQLDSVVGTDAEARLRVEPRERAASIDDALGGVVRCRVDVLGSAETEWICELYEERTMHSPRRKIAEHVGRGTEEMVWDVTPGPIGVRILSTQAVGREYERLDVAEGGEVDVAFELTERFAAFGVVRTAKGDPVPGARVLLVPATPPMPPGGDRFDFDGFDDGRLTVVADAEGGYEVLCDPTASYAGATTHPGFQVTRESGIAGQPGERVEIDFELQPGHQVTGRLLLAPGVPLVGLPLQMMDDRMNPYGTRQWEVEGRANTDAEGRFAFDSIASGRKLIVTQGGIDDAETVCWVQPLALEGEGLTDLGDQVVGASVLDARVEAEDSSPFSPEVRLLVFPEVDDPDPDPDPDLVFHVTILCVVRDGSVRVRGLPKCRLLARVRDGAEQAEGLEREGRTFEEHHDGFRLTTTWTLPAVGPSTRTELLPTLVVEFPEDHRNAVGFVIVPGVDLLICPPGGGVTLRLEDVPRAEMRFCRDGRFGVQTPSVDGGALQVFDAPLDRVGNDLRIRVLDGGRAVAGAQVLLGADVPAMPVTTTDAEGRAYFSGLPPDLTFNVQARNQGKASKIVPVEYVAGKAEIELVLE